MPDSDRETRLHMLLDANAAFALAARGTTNHCPMALIALARMGASPERLSAFFTYWERSFALPAVPSPHAVAREAWHASRGEPRAFAALRDCFEAWLTEAGPREVLGEVFGVMPPSPASGAFHALIRLAYGLEAGHFGEIAAALAAFVVAPLPVDVPRVPRLPAASAAEGFAHIVRATGGAPFAGGSIVARVRAVVSDARFAEHVLAPPRESDLLGALALATLAAYWRNPDFTVLHTVTATHAARVVCGWLAPDLAQQLCEAHWYALCAAYAAVGEAAAEPVRVAVSPEPPDWPALCAQASAAHDDHVIKMVYTCFSENRHAPSMLYGAAAARLLSRNP